MVLKLVSIAWMDVRNVKDLTTVERARLIIIQMVSHVHTAQLANIHLVVQRVSRVVLMVIFINLSLFLKIFFI